jgi:hypothetical protein
LIAFSLYNLSSGISLCRGILGLLTNQAQTLFKISLLLLIQSLLLTLRIKTLLER